MIVTIDGPAGSGKSTTARAVAEELDFLYLDTGAMYRAVALAFLQNEVSPDREGARTVLNGLRLDVRYTGDGAMQVFLEGEDVTDAIRTEKVGEMASQISTLAAVRTKLVAEQRRITRNQNGHPGVVLEGRDTGTKVFPNADVKVYLVADVTERARRRYQQLRERGEDAVFDRVLEDLKQRDAQDMERAISPLVKAEDAIEVDTTDLTIEEQVEAIVDLVRARA